MAKALFLNTVAEIIPKQKQKPKIFNNIRIVVVVTFRQATLL